jgi:hypothetical protein
MAAKGIVCSRLGCHHRGRADLPRLPLTLRPVQLARKLLFERDFPSSRSIQLGI